MIRLKHQMVLYHLNHQSTDLHWLLYQLMKQWMHQQMHQWRHQRIYLRSSLRHQPIRVYNFMMKVVPKFLIDNKNQSQKCYFPKVTVLIFAFSRSFNACGASVALNPKIVLLKTERRVEIDM